MTRRVAGQATGPGRVATFVASSPTDVRRRAVQIESALCPERLKNACPRTRTQSADGIAPMGRSMASAELATDCPRTTATSRPAAAGQRRSGAAHIPAIRAVGDQGCSKSALTDSPAWIRRIASARAGAILITLSLEMPSWAATGTVFVHTTSTTSGRASSL